MAIEPTAESIIIVGYTNGDLFDTNAGLSDFFIVKYDSTGVLMSYIQFGICNSHYV